MSAKFQVGQVVWDKEDGSYVRIRRILTGQWMLWVERFGNHWSVLPSKIRPLTKREKGGSE